MFKMVVHLNGPTSVGKGYTYKLLNNHGVKGLKLGFVSIGEETRRHLKIDREFSEKWSGEMAKGNLISDEEACRLLELAIPSDKVDILVIDGFNRTLAQVDYSAAVGLSGTNSINLFLRATRNSCRQRFLHRRDSGIGALRTDNELAVFEKRYSDYGKKVDRIVNKLLRTDTAVRIVPADGDIPTQVFPDVLAHIIALYDTLSTPRAEGGIASHVRNVTAGIQRPMMSFA